MEALWDDENAAETFLWKLRVQRARELLETPEVLCTLRFDMDSFRIYERTFGPVYQALKIDFFGEVYRASEKRLDLKENVQRIPPAKKRVRPCTVRLTISVLPRDIVRLIELFTGQAQTKKHETPPPEPVPEYDSYGNYGHYGETAPAIKIV